MMMIVSMGIISLVFKIYMCLWLYVCMYVNSFAHVKRAEHTHVWIFALYKINYHYYYYYYLRFDTLLKECMLLKKNVEKGQIFLKG